MLSFRSTAFRLPYILIHDWCTLTLQKKCNLSLHFMLSRSEWKRTQKRKKWSISQIEFQLFHCTNPDINYIFNVAFFYAFKYNRVQSDAFFSFHCKHTHFTTAFSIDWNRQKTGMSNNSIVVFLSLTGTHLTACVCFFRGSKNQYECIYWFRSINLLVHTLCVYA